MHCAHLVSHGERCAAGLLFVEPVSSFLVPVFFVVMGARVDLHVLASGPALGAAVALTLTAVMGKLACAMGASGSASA